jgi:hypothetical protein
LKPRPQPTWLVSLLSKGTAMERDNFTAQIPPAPLVLCMFYSPYYQKF